MGTMVHNPGARGYGPYEYALGDELRGERATLGKTLLDIQRDLRIKAAYIAAIEDAKPEVFPNPSFIAGYVRSYARYLAARPGRGLPPLLPGERLRRRKGARRPGAGRRRRGAAAAQPMAGGFRPDFPLARLEARRHAGDPAVGDRLGPGAGRRCSPASATAAGPCCRTSSGCSSPRSRSCRWRWPRSTRSTRPRRRRSTSRR